MKEFSKDKEKWVPDDALSCNHCEYQEDIERDVDSPLSFLVKFKSDNTADPKSIKLETSGFILPNSLSYEFQQTHSFFTSVSKNHYNLKVSGDKLKELGAGFYQDQANHVVYARGDVKEYLKSSYTQSNWQNLLSDGSRSKWRAYIGRLLKEALVDDFGTIDVQCIDEAMMIDKTGFLNRVREIASFNGFSESEKLLLKKYL